MLHTKSFPGPRSLDGAHPVTQGRGVPDHPSPLLPISVAQHVQAFCQSCQGFTARAVCSGCFSYRFGGGGKFQLTAHGHLRVSSSMTERYLWSCRPRTSQISSRALCCLPLVYPHPRRPSKPRPPPPPEFLTAGGWFTTDLATPPRGKDVVDELMFMTSDGAGIPSISIDCAHAVGSPGLRFSSRPCFMISQRNVHDVETVLATAAAKFEGDQALNSQSQRYRRVLDHFVGEILNARVCVRGMCCATRDDGGSLCTGGRSDVAVRRTPLPALKQVNRLRAGRPRFVAA